MPGRSRWNGFPDIKYSVPTSVAVINGVIYAGGRFGGSGADQYGGVAKLENGKCSKLTTW